MDEFRLEKLNSSNYSAWSIRVRAALVQKGCWSTIDPGCPSEKPTEAWKSQDQKALTYLFLVVEDEYLDDIAELTSAREAWNVLKERHTKYGLLHTLQLLRELFSARKGTEPVAEYVGKLTDLHRKVTAGGHGFADREFALIILMGLPQQYDSLILNLERDEMNLTTAMVKSRLAVEEKRLERSEAETSSATTLKALKTQEKKYWHQPNADNMKIEGRRDTKCFACGGWGHIAKNCRRKGERPHTAKRTIEEHRALLVNQQNKTQWYLDSGATEHMCSDKTLFKKIRPKTTSVIVANAERLSVQGIGDVMLKPSEERDDREGILLSDTLYIPGLEGNLLSVGRIEEKGMTVSFVDGKAIVRKGKEEILTAHREGRLYVVSQRQHRANIVSDHEELMHRRLGHPHNYATKDLCQICVQAKMKRRSYPGKTEHRATEVLEIIHSDVVGKITPTSRGGSNYFITFTDDYSRHSTVYMMKTKDEALSKFQHYQRMCEKLHNRSIKILRSDNGGEYINSQFNKYLLDHGIQRQLTVPESPQQNGVAERKNQTIMNTARCLMIESGIDQDLWAEAVSTATYLRNRCPSIAIDGSTPQEMWSGEQNLKNLRVFGCRAWAHIRAQSTTSKLEARANEYVMVGYPEGVKGYKLYDRKTKRFFISRDVIFEEKIFPFKSVTNYIDTNGKQEDELSQIRLTFREPEPKTSEMDDPTSYDEETDDEPSNGSGEDDPVTVEDDPINPLSPKTQEETSNAIRERRNVRLPKRLEDHIIYMTKESAEVPVTVREALESDEANEWRNAMEEEMENMTRAEAWKLTTKPPGAKVISSKWVFARKPSEEGSGTKYKARLVARGFMQNTGQPIEETETYAPVIRLKSIRMLLAIAAEKGFEIHQMDIKAAYLHGTLEDEVYMTQPEGYVLPGRENLVCRLQKSIYGLKQSGKIWNDCLNKVLVGLGLKGATADPCIYYNHERNVIVGVYVDDLLITGDLEGIRNLKREIMNNFNAKDLGNAKRILAMNIKQETDGSYTLDQTDYAEEILDTFGMQNAKSASTPLDPTLQFPKGEEGHQENATQYRRAIGSLLYLSNGTRPDLAYAVSYMAQFCEGPSEQHWRGVKHIMRYLRGTKELKLRYRKTHKGMEIFSDADWASDPSDRRSYSGYVAMLGGAPVSWCSQKQKSVALSSTEAEYVAMCLTAKEVIWMQSLMNEVKPGMLEETQQIRADNQAAIFLAVTRSTSERSKHIAIKHFFLRELVAERRIAFSHISGSDNPADLFTKRVKKQVLLKLRNQLIN